MNPFKGLKVSQSRLGPGLVRPAPRRRWRLLAVCPRAGPAGPQVPPVIGGANSDGNKNVGGATAVLLDAVTATGAASRHLDSEGGRAVTTRGTDWPTGRAAARYFG